MSGCRQQVHGQHLLSLPSEQGIHPLQADAGVAGSISCPSSQTSGLALRTAPSYADAMLYCTFARMVTALVVVLGWWLASPLQAQPLSLANHYHTGIELHAYWVSEKYDGIRAHWTGQRLLSRQGLPIDAPAWFTQGWPNTPLDGELWAGRNQFVAVQSTVAQGAADAAGWRAIQYMVFDVPGHTGHFAQRQQQLQRTVRAIGQAWVQAAPQWQVRSHDALMRQLRDLSRLGAEGLMLRRADSPYRAGRSDDDALWAKFREAADTFFNARQADRDQINSSEKENLAKKEELLKKAEALVPVADAKAAKQARQKLAEIQGEWDQIGYVPREDMRRIEDRLDAVDRQIKAVEDAAWKKSDPEADARKSSFEEQLNAQLKELDDKIAAESDPAKKAKLEAEKATKEQWLNAIK